MAGMAAAIPAFWNFCSKAPPSGHFVFTGCHAKILLPATPLVLMLFMSHVQFFRAVSFTWNVRVVDCLHLLRLRPDLTVGQSSSSNLLYREIQIKLFWIRLDTTGLTNWIDKLSGLAAA